MIKNIFYNNILIKYTKISVNKYIYFYIANILDTKINFLTNIFKNINIKAINNHNYNWWLLNSYIIFKTIFKEIYGIYIGGSRALNINSDNSDIDIVFILPNKYIDLIKQITKFPFPLFYLENTKINTHAHFYFHSYDKLFKYPYFQEWAVEAYLNRKNNLLNSIILDKNKVDIFFNTTLKEAYIPSMKNLKESHNMLLTELKSNDLIWLSKMLDKNVVHLAIINCQLQNKQIDKDKIIKLKEYAKLNCNRLLMDPPIQFEPEIMQYLKDSLIELNDYFENRFNE